MKCPNNEMSNLQLWYLWKVSLSKYIDIEFRHVFYKVSSTKNGCNEATEAFKSSKYHKRKGDAKRPKFIDIEFCHVFYLSSCLKACLSTCGNHSNSSSFPQIYLSFYQLLRGAMNVKSSRDKYFLKIKFIFGRKNIKS